jgi:hypothetical protein
VPNTAVSHSANIAPRTGVGAAANCSDNRSMENTLHTITMTLTSDDLAKLADYGDDGHLTEPGDQLRSLLAALDATWA